ncbi:MAG TPA: GAF domain-containing protein, partial [bacterium (Candidatus Stahlbacteria)]|nr:GAF domain-containing protein [Candidatus Stahlbacteria bacterium]
MGEKIWLRAVVSMSKRSKKQKGHSKTTSKPDYKRDLLLTELEISRRLDRVFGTTYDLSKLVRRITKEIGRVIDISNFYFAVYDEKERKLNFIIYYEEGKELSRESRKLSGGMTEYVIEIGKPLLINHDIRGHCEKLGITPYGRDARSWLGVPVSFRSEILGVITIQDYKKEYAFKDEDVKFLRNVAAKIGMVLWSTRQVESQRRRASLFRLLAQVAKRSTRYLSLDQVLQIIDQAIRTNASELSFRLYLKERDRLKLVSHAHDENWDFDLPYILGLGSLTTEEETIIAFPLNWRKTIIGFLTLRLGPKVPRDEIKIYESLSDQIAIAIGNALLFQETKERARRL